MYFFSVARFVPPPSCRWPESHGTVLFASTSILGRIVDDLGEVVEEDDTVQQDSHLTYTKLAEVLTLAS